VERVKLPNQPHPLQLIKKRELAELLCVNPWTIDRWRKRGIIPQPITLSDQVLAWRISTIEQWLRQREAADA
jgi:predicted DNA-binding transcriptional regulator AlpA